MSNWKHILFIAVASSFLLVGCGGSSSSDGDSDDGDPTGDTGTTTGTSTFSDESADAFLTRIETTIPGCTYVNNSTSSARYSAAIPGVVSQVRESNTFNVDALEATSESMECTNASGVVDGAIVMTTNEEASEMSIDFQECNLGNYTDQNTNIDGFVTIATVQDEVTGEPSSFSASTGATGVTIIDNTDEAQNVTLVLTGTNTLVMGEATEADPTIVNIEHLVLTDNLDSSNSFQIDSCIAKTWDVGDNTYLELQGCDYQDADGVYTNTGTVVTNNLTDEATGTITSTASDGSTMVLTLADNGLIEVAVDGAAPVILDCSEVDAEIPDLEI